MLVYNTEKFDEIGFVGVEKTAKRKVIRKVVECMPLGLKVLLP